MKVKVTTELPISAEEACALARKPATFRHVVWPVFATGRLPERVEVGDEVGFRLWFLGFVPAWTHYLRLVSIGPLEIYTNERGGPVRVWNHRLTFEPLSDRSCRYTDEIEIHAGISTLATVAFAHATFRWRQRRWRVFARLLA